MSEPNSDPHEDGLKRLAQLASLVTSGAETAVRIMSLRLQRTATTPSSSPSPQADASSAARASSSVPPSAPSARQARPRTPPQEGATAPPTVPSSRSAGPASNAPSLTSSAPARLQGASRGRTAEDLYAVHHDAHHFFCQRVSNSWVPVYLGARRLDVALQEPWSAGYAPAGWTNLTDHLRRRGWSDEVLLASGLSRRARTGNLIDHFRDRLMLPIRVQGDIVGFIGRSLAGADLSVPKYVNSPATEIYNKSSVLFGVSDHRDVRWSGATPVLVEGPLDAIAVSSCEQDRWVGMALCGTAMTEAHVSAIYQQGRPTGQDFVVATDQDRAGDAAAERALRLLAPHAPRLDRLCLPSEQDPAGVLRTGGADSLASLLASGREPLLHAVVEARLRGREEELQWVQGRVRAARHVAPIIASLPVQQQPSATAWLAARLDVMESTATDAVQRAGIKSRTSAARGSRSFRPSLPTAHLPVEQSPTAHHPPGITHQTGR